MEARRMTQKITILCHVTPWCKDQFSSIADGIDKTAVVEYISGFSSVDSTGYSELFNKEFDQMRGVTLIGSNVDLEIIRRCRLLRAYESDLALKYVITTRKVVLCILDKIKPRLFISGSVDQYLHDILFQECEKKNIATAGFIRTFINGYYRISNRGEYHKSRDVSDLEVEKVKCRLMDTSYIPDNLISLKKSLRKTYISIMVKNILRVVWFNIVRQLPTYRHQYHCNASYLITRSEGLHFFPMRQLGDANWKTSIDINKKTVFFPLQHFPEATIDYWVDDLKLINYINVVSMVLSKLSSEFNVLVKEHPGVWGYRKPNFYKSIISNNKSLIVVPTEELSNSCVDISDAVFVLTGSIGFEAALRGKLVLTLTDTYYLASCKELIHRLPWDFTLEEIKSLIDKTEQYVLTEKKQHSMVRYILNGCQPGVFRNDGSYTSTNINHVKEAKEIGEKLRSEILY
jgi:hypothetical protein